MIEDQKEYHQVFKKDDRSKRGTDGYKKRFNLKEAKHRQYQQQKRHGQAEQQPQSEPEEGRNNKKYQNGKQKKELKQQAYWVDQPQSQKKNSKKAKKK